MSEMCFGPIQDLLDQNDRLGKMLGKLVGYAHAHLGDPGHVSESLLLGALDEATDVLLARRRLEPRFTAPAAEPGEEA